MDWFDIRNNPNVHVITQQDYRGFKLKLVENKGWKISFGKEFLEEEYLFPTFQDAKHVVDRIHEDIVNVYGGLKMKKQS